MYLICLNIHNAEIELWELIPYVFSDSLGYKWNITTQAGTYNIETTQSITPGSLQREILGEL